MGCQGSDSAINGSWVMQGNNDAKICLYGNNYVTNLKLENNKYAFIEYNDSKLFVFFEEIYDKSIVYYRYVNNVLVNIPNKKLEYGDYVFCFGLRITLFLGIVSIDNLYNLRHSNRHSHHKRRCYNGEYYGR